MLALLLVLATVVHQDTTIVIHPDSSGATLQALELPRVVTDEVIHFYNSPMTTRLVRSPPVGCSRPCSCFAIHPHG